jgi:glycogen debranching enzyme
LKQLPRHLIPCYFEAFVDAFFNAARSRFVALSSPFVRNGSDFVQRLALCSVQLHGVVPSAPLLARRPALGSLAAGLPHFASGFMRNWGRDTFISLRGLLLLTGRLTDAKETILAYGAILSCVCFFTCVSCRPLTLQCSDTRRA